MTNSKKILAPVIFMICGVLLFWRVSSHTEDVAQQNAEKFYATLQVGAAFDRAAFEQRIKAMGRVRNFGDFEQAQAAVLHDEKENPYPLEVAVITAGREDLYYTWFIAPIPRWFRWTAWLTGNSDPLFNFRYATYAFSVKNGKIIEKLAFKKEGSPWIGWVVIDTIRPDEEGTRREKEARTQQESEEATRQRAEALYATLQIGAPFDRSDFERQIAAMGGKVEDFGNFGDFNVASGDLYAQRRDEAWQRGASRLDVAVVPQGDVAYYTAFFTPYPGFINENRRKGESMLGTLSFYAFQVRDGIVVKKSVKKNGEWVDFN